MQLADLMGVISQKPGFGTIAVVPPGAYALGCWRWTEDRRRTRTVRGRKVRAPQDREIGNADPGQPEGKRHREQTARVRAGNGEKVE